MSDPTIVLVHGAFADGSSWEPVTRVLHQRGHRVIAVANPLRGLDHDSTYVRAVLDTLPAPVVLVGHSYGGAVITNAATGAENVTALVYVAAFAPDEGESAGQLDEKFGGPATRITRPSPLPAPAVPAGDGPPNIELSIDPAQYGTMFLQEADADTAAALAAAQRPITLAALLEPSGPPAWHSIPAYYAISTDDHMIPVHGQREMAARINATTVEVAAGHVAMFSQAEAIADLITTAAENS